MITDSPSGRISVATAPIPGTPARWSLITRASSGAAIPRARSVLLIIRTSWSDPAVERLQCDIRTCSARHLLGREDLGPDPIWRFHRVPGRSTLDVGGNEGAGHGGRRAP